MAVVQLIWNQKYSKHRLVCAVSVIGMVSAEVCPEDPLCFGVLRVLGPAVRCVCETELSGRILSSVKQGYVEVDVLCCVWCRASAEKSQGCRVWDAARAACGLVWFLPLGYSLRRAGVHWNAWWSEFSMNDRTCMAVVTLNCEMKRVAPFLLLKSHTIA